ncbi:MAG: OmpL47-type beta-barrel domain-containing protein [Brevinema sp.]
MKKQLLIMLLLGLVQLNAQETVEETMETNMVQNTDVMDTNMGEMNDQNFETVPVTPMENTAVQNVGYTLTNGDYIYASPKARFSVQGVDEQSGLKEIFVSIDGSDYAPYKNSIAFSTEGDHSLSYKFIDRVGNVSYSKVFSITVDATAPRVLEVELNPAPYYASGTEYVGVNTEISFRAYDDMTGLAFVEFASQDQEMMRFESNTTFGSLGYTNTSALLLSYQATDMVSNVSPVKSRFFAVDATAPSLDVFAKAVEIDGIRYISSRDTIQIEAYDYETMVSKIMYAINDGDFKSYDAQIGINLKEAGEYVIQAKATDIVGNESAIVEYKVVVDILSPTGDISYIGEEASSQYDPFVGEEDAPLMETEADTEMDNTTNDMSTTEMDTAIDETPAVEMNDTTGEMPAGTAVDVMDTVQ